MNSENPLVVASSQVGSSPADWLEVVGRGNCGACSLYPAVLGNCGGFTHPFMCNIFEPMLLDLFEIDYCHSFRNKRGLGGRW